MLRAHHCVRCGDPMPLGRRVDRRYCRASCRTSAYRERSREAAPRTTGRGRRRDSEPLPPDLLLALRQIPPAVLTALTGWFGEHASSEQLTAARQRIAELEQQVQRARAELAAQQQAHHREQQRQRQEESAQRARDQKAREAEGRQHSEAVTKQIAELGDALWRLQAQSAEQAAALNQERDEHAFTRQSAMQQVADYGRQVRQALSDKESAQADAQSLRRQLHAAQARCEELQGKLTTAKDKAREQKQEHRQSLNELRRGATNRRQQPRPKRQPRAATTEPTYTTPPDETVSLFGDGEGSVARLMMDYVIHRDALARHIAWRKGRDPEWEILPDHMNSTVAVRAAALLITRRHQFILRPGSYVSHAPYWIDYGHKLDPASEAFLQAEIRRDLKKLKRKLSRYD